MTKIDELVKSRKSPFSVIPAPHPVRDKLQPESILFSQLRSNSTPVFTEVLIDFGKLESDGWDHSLQPDQ